MDPRVSVITLACDNPAASRRFYVEGLGWTPLHEVPGELLMIAVGPQLVLSLWQRGFMEEAMGPLDEGSATLPFALAQMVPTRSEVDLVLRTARIAGAPMVEQAREREWGGYSGYFADPDGHRWAVTWNPTPVGKLLLPHVVTGAH